MASHYDLHTHSTASDGTLRPAALVAHAARCGVRVLALTDHDTLTGLPEARAAALTTGIELIDGVEISVTWERITVHVVGLRIDGSNRLLRQGLAVLNSRRRVRALAIAAGLERRHLRGALAGAQAQAGNAAVTRTHFARWLVAAGHAPNLAGAFKRFLARNRPGYVGGEWASLVEAVDWVHAAGGRAALAHPLRYPLSARRLRRLVADFAACGGDALEVASGRTSPDKLRFLAQVGGEHELLASVGSDYHGPEQAWLQPGCTPKLPSGCPAVWRDWPAVSASCPVHRDMTADDSALEPVACPGLSSQAP